jgi:hypothetical protein
MGLMTAALAAVVFVGITGAKDEKGKAGDPEAPSCHGTAVNFVATPSEAAQQAKKDEKLVFVLHVSGQFEDPSIT